jgi:predicted phosphohydrolase
LSKVRLIGDIHGAWDYYKNYLIDPDLPSIQVGDFGFGFNSKKDQEMLKWLEANPDQRFIRGNHDDPSVCNLSKNYLPDGYVYNDEEYPIMYLGGAWSIDYGLRREFVDWWPDEECSTDQFEKFYETYKEVKPRVMITHDAPLQVASWIGLLGKGDFQMTTRTALWLGRMLHVHKPELWVFGHWHKNIDKTTEGTRFICLGINETRDLDLDTLELT